MIEEWRDKTPIELADIIFNEDTDDSIVIMVAKMYQAAACGYLSDEAVPALDALCEAERQLLIAADCLRENAEKLTEIRNSESK